MKINDLNVYPAAPAPTMPPVGQCYQDPTFGTTILRVTGPDEGDMAPTYSAVYDFANTDSTHIAYQGTDGWHWIADLDVAKRTVSNKRKLKIAGPTYWSRIEPNVLYVVSTWQEAKLWRYGVQADKWALIKDFGAMMPTMIVPNTSGCDSRGMSWDDDRFHISSANARSVFVYSVKSDALVGKITLDQASQFLASSGAPVTDNFPYSFGKTQMDASGKLVLPASEELLINVETGAMFAPHFGTPQHIYGDVHVDFGSSGMATGSGGGLDNQGFYAELVTIDPANLPTYLSGRKRIGLRSLWGIDTHASFRRKDQAWVTITNDGTQMGADLNAIPIFADNEVFQLAPDGPPDGSKNRRLFRWYADPLPAGADWYWPTTRACDSQDGRVVGFQQYRDGKISLYIAFIDEQPVDLTRDDIRKLKNLAGLLA